MRSSQLPRPQAKFKSKLKKKQIEALSCISAEDRVNAFLSQLNTTPIVNKPTKTKKIHYSTKQTNLMVTNNRKYANNTNKIRRNNKENMKPMQTQMNTKQRNRNNRRNNNNNNNMIQQRKTSIARPMTNYSNNSNNKRKKSLSCTNSSPLNEQNKIDQYSLSLQIKNSECELLKNENKQLKNEIEQLKDTNNKLINIENEHENCKQQILNLHQGLINKNDRILKLEHKLESCCIDPIALKSPEFMNADTEKSIIFWRERLCKASQKLKQKKIKQKQHLQTVNYYIQQLQQ